MGRTRHPCGTRLAPFAGLPGQQKSRVSDNRKVVFGKNTFLAWEVDVSGVAPEVRDQVLPVVRARLAFAANRDVQSNKLSAAIGNTEDQNLADHLMHGSITSGHWDQYGERVYIGRLRFVDEQGNHRTIDRKLVAEFKQQNPAVLAGIDALLKSGAAIVIRANPTSGEANLSPLFGTSWGGDQKELVLPKRWKITAVGHGRKLDTLWIRYKQPNGETFNVRFGGNNTADEMFELQEGESIIKVTGQAGRLVERLQFHTNRGRSSPAFGEDRGKMSINAEAPSGQELMGIRLRSGDRLDRIQFLWRPKH